MFPDDSSGDCDILTIVSCLITRFELPVMKLKPAGANGVDSTTVCTDNDFTLACSCLLCCIGEFAVKEAQSSFGSGSGLLRGVARQLLFLSLTCLLVLEKSQQAELMCTLCVHAHAILVLMQSSAVDELMHPCDAWVALLEPLQYNQHSNLAQTSVLLLDYLDSTNRADEMS